jgi:hypothetical protein
MGAAVERDDSFRREQARHRLNETSRGELPGVGLVMKNAGMTLASERSLS